jgi:hypothetical protein
MSRIDKAPKKVSSRLQKANARSGQKLIEVFEASPLRSVKIEPARMLMPVREPDKF